MDGALAHPDRSRSILAEFLPMHPRLISLLGVAASSSLACVASTKCLPDVMPVRTTLVRGDYEQLVVSEFQVMDGCAEIVLDSIVRRPAVVDTFAVDRKYALEPSAAVTLHLRATYPDLDSAARAACRGRHMRRRVDRAPLAESLLWTDLGGGKVAVTQGPVVPVAPDSVFVCLGGSCQRRIADEVDNRPAAERCLEGALAPIGRDSARTLLLETLAKAPILVDLNRPTALVPKGEFAARAGCLGPVPVAARSAATASMLADSRFQWVVNNRTPWGSLPSLPDWNDTGVTPDLARPDRFSAGDYFEREVLTFSVNPIRGPSTMDFQRSWNYATGVKTYQYAGAEDDSWGCLVIPAPRRMGDSLQLDGQSVRLSNEGCARRDVDVFANDHQRWLFAPSGDDWASSFRHGANLDNGTTWPIDGDSVVVRGWKFALDGVLAAVSVSGRAIRGAGPDVRVVDGALAVRLASAGAVRLATPGGRILATGFLPAGEGTMRLPSGHRGLLLVTTPDGTARLMLP